MGFSTCARSPCMGPDVYQPPLGLEHRWCLSGSSALGNGVHKGITQLEWGVKSEILLSLQCKLCRSVCRTILDLWIVNSDHMSLEAKFVLWHWIFLQAAKLITNMHCYLLQLSITLAFLLRRFQSPGKCDDCCPSSDRCYPSKFNLWKCSSHETPLLTSRKSSSNFHISTVVSAKWFVGHWL
mgnify:CR=1 FL=1